MGLLTVPLHSLGLQAGKALHWLTGLGSLVVAFGMAVLFSGAQANAAPAPKSVPNIVLVHGAFADGSSWLQVIPRLQAMGYHVTAVQNPLTSLTDDVAATVRVLQRQKGDVLLVGHSWAGAVITQAGNASSVRGLVYLSALAPDSGESVADLLEKLKSPMEGLVPDVEGLVWLDDPEAFRHVMGADLSMKQVQALTAIQQPIAAACFTGKIRHAAWHDKPSWYLRTKSDQALRPDVQKAIAQRIGAKVMSVDSSHLSLLSHPDEVARLIDRAAREIAQ